VELRTTCPYFQLPVDCNGELLANPGVKSTITVQFVPVIDSGIVNAVEPLKYIPSPGWKIAAPAEAVALFPASAAHVVTVELGVTELVPVPAG